MPVTLDGQELGMVGAILPEDVASSRLLLVSLQNVLKPVVVDSALAKLAAVKADNGYIPIAALKDAGVGAKIDPLTLSLSLDVPGELRKAQVVDLKGHGAPPVTGVGAAVTPATVSSYINAHGLADYVNNGATPGLQPLNLGVDGALNYKGQVLQSTVNYISGEGRRWQRGDTRLVHDDSEHAIRYQFGDLLYSLAGLQTSTPLGGFSFARDYTLQPYTNIQPAGQQQFILTSPSKVEVDVNGRPTQVIQLPAGRYDIRNFPFAQGANDVDLKVTDSSGRVTTTTIPYFFDSTLLDQGVSVFNYSAGLPMVTTDGLRYYHSTFPSYSMYHRYGVTDTVTAGINSQGNNRLEMLGLELGTATPIGNLHFDVAGSRTADFGYDYAAQAQYNYSNISSTGVARNLVTQVSFTGDRFATLGTLAPGNTSKLDISSRYSQPLFYDVYGGLGGTYEINRNKDNSYNFDVNFRRNITQTINADVDLIRSFDENGKIDNRILFTVTVSFDGGRQFGRAGYDSDQRAKTADWEYIPTSDLYHPYGDLHVGNSTQSSVVNGDLNYNTSRFETTLSHNETYPGGATTGSSLQRDTSVAMGSALVFADGKAALARPVADSFAIVGEQKNADGYAFKVDPQGDNYTTRNDFFMPAVIPNLSAYELRTTQLDVPDLPAGYDIGPETFVLQPTYRSGSLIKLGTDATVFLDGVLVGSNDKPLSLVSGTIKEVGASNAQPITFFTNRAGRFRVEGLKPGKFEMEFTGAFPGVTQQFSVPSDANGIYHIGTIKLSVEQGE
ncbi:MAG TPA: fimbria/pilus outer membrane usher protein [Stellaceae bacterium]